MGEGLPGHVPPMRASEESTSPIRRARGNTRRTNGGGRLPGADSGYATGESPPGPGKEGNRGQCLRMGHSPTRQPEADLDLGRRPPPGGLWEDRRLKGILSLIQPCHVELAVKTRAAAQGGHLNYSSQYIPTDRVCTMCEKPRYSVDRTGMCGPCRVGKYDHTPGASNG